MRLKVKIKFENYEEIIEKMSSIQADGNKALAKSITRGLLFIETNCKKKVQDKISKGRQYGKQIASKPGYPPNTDTGFLAGQMHVRLEPDGLTGHFVSGAWYSSFLEYGTVNMEARPFVYPAFAEELPGILKDFQETARKEIIKGA